MNNGHAPDPRAELRALAVDKLDAIEAQAGPLLGLPPWHSRYAGSAQDGRPIYGVFDRTGAAAIEVGLDPVSAQLIAAAATKRSGLAPIACLVMPGQNQKQKDEDDG